MSAPAFESLDPTALTWLFRALAPGAPDEAFADALPPLVPEPDWLSALRAQAQARFGSVGMPSRRNEAWRYVDLRALLQTPFEPAPAPHTLDAAHLDDLLAPHRLDDAEPLRLTFVNGQFFPGASSSPDALAETPGLTLTTLHAVLRDPQALAPEMLAHLQASLFADLGLEDDAFALLNALQGRDAAIVMLADDVALARPVQVLFAQSGSPDQPQLACQRAVLVLGARAQATVSLQFVGDDATPYWANSALHCVCDENSRLDLVLSQADGANGAGFLATRATLAKNSHLALTTTTFSGQLVRHAFTARLQGEGAHLELNGLNALRGETRAHQRAVIVHQAPNARSVQTFKCILDGQSRADFDGVIVVGRHAIGTDATQLNKNLLLSDNAQALTRPQLRIDADDVKCAHGATVAQLEPDELFYLASRGLPPHVAQCLLTFGFAEDIAQSVAHPAIRQYLERQILRTLDHQNSPLSCFAECDICPASRTPQGC